jgi:hypothetical protein
MFSASAMRSSRMKVFHLGHGAVALGGAQAGEVKLAHLLRIHSLGCKGAQSALEPCVDLILHHRFGNRERILLGEGGHEMVFGLGGHAALFAVGHVLAHPIFELGQVSRSCRVPWRSRRSAQARSAS